MPKGHRVGDWDACARAQVVGRTSALDPYGTVAKRLVLLSARSRLEPAHANRVVSPARRAGARDQRGLVHY